jgi:hypothetical protein
MWLAEETPLWPLLPDSKYLLPLIRHDFPPLPWENVETAQDAVTSRDHALG